MNPILIPSDSYLEGYLKSLKSIRIECNFNGTILTIKKLSLISHRLSQETLSART